jgi:hypothetical protein
MPYAFKIALFVFVVGTVLTLLFLPALDIAWFRIQAPDGTRSA